jgi:hypothetical protein
MSPEHQNPRNQRPPKIQAQDSKPKKMAIIFKAHNGDAYVTLTVEKSGETLIMEVDSNVVEQTFRQLYNRAFAEVIAMFPNHRLIDIK